MNGLKGKGGEVTKLNVMNRAEIKVKRKDGSR